MYPTTIHADLATAHRNDLLATAQAAHTAREARRARRAGRRPAGRATGLSSRLLRAAALTRFAQA